ncbi:MAG: sigma-70 family RNA polymerase sigma factor [Burkholderiales bacterium]|nr:sigma-70 family RNA polymerase sigma factor [Burkholderiales bacterium]
MDRSDLIAHLPGLRRYARVLTGSTWAADDLVQDTLERACSKWRLWVVGSDLRAWLFTLMHNLHASDVRRALRRQPDGGTVDVDEVAHLLSAPDEATALGLDLQRCLLLLPEEQRVVLLLVCLEDMAYADVARITGTPIGTVMSRLSRARSRLQQLLDAPAVVPGEHTANRAPNLRRLK